jgi:hypothetical protein
MDEIARISVLGSMHNRQGTVAQYTGKVSITCESLHVLPCHAAIYTCAHAAIPRAREHRAWALSRKRLHGRRASAIVHVGLSWAASDPPVATLL